MRLAPRPPPPDLPGMTHAARDLRIAFDNSYASLPERFHARLAPTPVAAPRLIRLNAPLARDLGLDPEALAGQAGLGMLAGNHVPEGAAPLAQAYAGHQFGQFTPQLGDGRAILLGEVIAPDGRRRDLQLKGSGPTPFSRRGDGRAALGPVLREYLVSEAMAALGIPTTRALAAVTTGEDVLREARLPGAVLTRVAASHLRVGTFQFFAARGDVAAVRILADYAIARHYPAAAGAANPYRALLAAVIAAQATLIARWMLVGFVHGVMNTDNCAISGETIDYGPCAFLEAYDPAAVFSSIDHYGRYAFANQPRIAHWNLARLAEALLPLLDGEEAAAIEAAKAELARFSPHFEAAWQAGLRRKLGLAEAREGDAALAQALLEAMAGQGVDFTLAFHHLAAAALGRDAEFRALFADPGAADLWLAAWRARLAEEAVAPPARAAALRAVNPAVIPRNHLVEGAILAATERDDFTVFEALLAVVTRPFELPPEPAFMAPARPEERVLATFCGT